jgi:hypothetical protein
MYRVSVSVEATAHVWVEAADAAAAEVVAVDATNITSVYLGSVGEFLDGVAIVSMVATLTEERSA